MGIMGELQAVLAEWMLAAPMQDRLSPEAAVLFWDLRHMLGIVSTRLGEWVTLGDFTGWALPVELFPASGPIGPRHEAGLFIANSLVRPLTWLGVLENSPQNVPAMSMMDNQFRKTVLFDKFFRIGLATRLEAVSLH
ncbi:hypothetical protein SB748_26290 [Rhizobium sp. SIMBA_035]